MIVDNSGGRWQWWGWGWWWWQWWGWLWAGPGRRLSVCSCEPICIIVMLMTKAMMRMIRLMMTLIMMMMTMMRMVTRMLTMTTMRMTLNRSGEAVECLQLWTDFYLFPLSHTWATWVGCCADELIMNYDTDAGDSFAYSSLYCFILVVWFISSLVLHFSITVSLSW